MGRSHAGTSACDFGSSFYRDGMSEHKVTLTWRRGDVPFEYPKYPRNHTWKFDGGHEMQATAAPAYLGDPKNVDPEEAFVAALSSCHMLTFLAVAAKKPNDQELDEMHHAAHDQCFIANSVKTEITVDAQK